MKELITLDTPELNIVEEKKKKELLEAFFPYAKNLNSFYEDYTQIIEESKKEINKELIEKARRLRLDILKIRTGSQKEKKLQKEDYLNVSRVIDKLGNKFKDKITELESELKGIENHFEILEQKRLQKLQEERFKIITQYIDNPIEDLAGMAQDVWQAYCDAKKKAYEDKIEAEKKAEEERIENERLDRLEINRKNAAIIYHQFWNQDSYDFRNMSIDEFKKLIDFLQNEKKKYDIKQEEIRIENERLKKEAEERERKEKEEAEKRAKIEAERKKKEEAERKAREEKERKEREAYEAKLKKECEEKERIRKENERIKKEAEEKEKKEAEEKEKAIQAELKKGDSAKMNDLLSDLEQIKTKYSFKAKEYKKKYTDIFTAIDKVIDYLKK